MAFAGYDDVYNPDTFWGPKGDARHCPFTKEQWFAALANYHPEWQYNPYVAYPVCVKMYQTYDYRRTTN